MYSPAFLKSPISCLKSLLLYQPQCHSTNAWCPIWTALSAHSNQSTIYPPRCPVSCVNAQWIHPNKDTTSSKTITALPGSGLSTIKWGLAADSSLGCWQAECSDFTPRLLSACEVTSFFSLTSVSASVIEVIGPGRFWSGEVDKSTDIGHRRSDFPWSLVHLATLGWSLPRLRSDGEGGLSALPGPLSPCPWHSWEQVP